MASVRSVLNCEIRVRENDAINTSIIQIERFSLLTADYDNMITIMRQ